jgi:hypothetical protein
LQFTHGKASLSINPVNSAKVTGSIKDNIVTYKNIYSNTDIKYTADEYRLKEDTLNTR